MEQLTPAKRAEAIQQWAKIICLELGIGNAHEDEMAKLLAELAECVRADAARPPPTDLKDEPERKKPRPAPKRRAGRSNLQIR